MCHGEKVFKLSKLGSKLVTSVSSSCLFESFVSCEQDEKRSVLYTDVHAVRECGTGSQRKSSILAGGGGRVGKNPVFFLKNPAQWVFFGFFGFFWGFWVFWVFLGFFARAREFLGFFKVSRILLGASRL
jgi:hypothetical protein